MADMEFTRPDGTPVRVLVVDDEVNIAELLAMALRYEGWEVRMAHTGRSAVSEAADLRPDAVVLDMMLPDFDGLEVLRRLRATQPDVPVLFLTARDAVEDRVAGLTAGGDDYVTKPFSLEEVVARLRALMRRSGAQQAVAQRAGGRRPDARRGQPRGEPRRRRDRPDGHRVRAAALLHAQPAAGAEQGADPRPGVAVRLRRPGQRGRALRVLPAQEDRRRPRADDPHHARRGLRPQAGLPPPDAPDGLGHREDADPAAGADRGRPGRDRLGAHRARHHAGDALLPRRPPRRRTCAPRSTWRTARRRRASTTTGTSDEDDDSRGRATTGRAASARASARSAPPSTAPPAPGSCSPTAATAASAPQEPLDPDVIAVLATVPADGDTHDVELPGLGEYRVIAEDRGRHRGGRPAGQRRRRDPRVARALGGAAHPARHRRRPRWSARSSYAASSRRCARSPPPPTGSPRSRSPRARSTSPTGCRSD